MRKKRIEKKAEKLNRKKIHDVLDMVLEINGTHPRDRELTGNKPTAFFEFKGHIATIEVYLYENGWTYPMYPDFSMSVHNGNEVKGLERKLEDAMEELRRAGKM